VGNDASLEVLRRVLIGRSQGNPLFLEETVWTLLETRGLVGERGGYQPAQALPRIHVPVTVQASLMARIHRLPPEEKLSLETAAVLETDERPALL
jgi:predicted ATPase